MKYSKTVITNQFKRTVHVRLNDECKNGHNDFAITMDVYRKAKNGRWMEDSFGCLHDEIYRLFPSLRPFIALHLCDDKGVPMYPIANGLYHYGETRKKYLRLTDEQLAIVNELNTQEHGYIKVFDYIREHVAPIWEKEANEAIKLLESLTGETYVRNEGSHFTCEEAKIQQMKEAIEKELKEGE